MNVDDMRSKPGLQHIDVDMSCSWIIYYVSCIDVDSSYIIV